MKKIYTILFTFVVFISKAQTNQLINNAWQLQNVEVNNVLVDAEIGLGDEYPFIGFEENDNIIYFMFDNLDGFLDLNETNQQFTITEPSLNFGDIHGTDAASLVVDGFFLSDPQNYVVNNPFSYSFRTENEVVYLDITNSNGDIATLFATTLSKTNFENLDFSIYPNPTSSLLHIETNHSDISSVEIFDVQGKQVMQVSSLNLSEIDVSQLANGMYFLKVSTSEGELSRKFVKR